MAGLSAATPSVEVTAIGVLSAHGAGLDALVDGMRAGRCPTRAADGIGYPDTAPPQCSRFPLAPRRPGEDGCADDLLGTVDRMLQQWRDAGPADAAVLRGDDTALVVGTGGFLYASGEELYWRWSAAPAGRAPFEVRGPDWGAARVAQHLGLAGPAFTLSTGCSSSANALLLAAEMIRRRRATRAIVIGAEGISAVTLSGFASLMLLDPLGCRPFDRDRAGVQLGEAVTALLLQAGPTRPAGVPCAILGGANRCDTHHLTSASPDGEVMREVMQAALDDAGVVPAQVVAVKAHGTGSPDSDAAEAAALCALFGGALPPVLAFKRLLGHTLGACGTLETAALAGCVQAGFLPAAAGFARFDPALGLAPLQAPMPAPDGVYLCNYFGFGGNYTSLVVRCGAP